MGGFARFGDWNNVCFLPDSGEFGVGDREVEEGGEVGNSTST